MDAKMELLLETRRYLWDYFEMHAAQRLRTFHFYLILCGAVLAGYVAILQQSLASSLGIVLGALLVFFSFAFAKLDRRTRDMIHYAEEGLAFLERRLRPEGEDNNAAVVGIFTYEEAQTAELGREPLWRPRHYYLMYRRCFMLVLAMMGALGFAAIVYGVALAILM
jgi:hypothetical protein